MEASVLLPLWRSGDVESLPDVLAEHVTFSSPVTDHNGQAKAAHMLGLLLVKGGERQSAHEPDPVVSLARLKSSEREIDRDLFEGHDPEAVHLRY